MAIHQFSVRNWTWSAVFAGVIASLVFQVLLLMAGFLFELWVVGSNTSADTRRELLGGLRDHIYMDLMRMSDATRGMLLDAKNDLDRRRLETAQTDLAASFAKFQSTFTNRAELLDSMRQLQNFVLRRFRFRLPAQIGRYARP